MQIKVTVQLKHVGHVAVPAYAYSIADVPKQCLICCWQGAYSSSKFGSMLP